MTGLLSGRTASPPSRFGRLELVGITKSFGALRANDGVSLAVEGGEIVGILGENGAGKSTLMNTLFGLHRPDAGEIRIDGRPVGIGSPRDAIALGIGMVHQHPALAEALSAAENAVLRLPFLPALDPVRHAARRLREAGERHGLAVDPARPVADLSAGERQRLEILIALAAGSRLLILDEPTSVLAPPEARSLLSALEGFAADGMAILLITHKLDEILAVARRVVVLRAGRVVGERVAAGAAKADLARLMVGRDLAGPAPRRRAPPGAPLLVLDRVSCPGPRGREALRDVSLAVRSGEILGVAGVSGNGQRELAECAAGLLAPSAGRVHVAGGALAGASPRRAAELGLAHIPEDRLGAGIAGGMSLAENACLRDGHRPPWCERGRVRRDRARARARRIIDAFGVVPADPAARAGALSGGNIQKFICGRELDGAPRVVVASHPTAGVDVGAARLIRDRLLAARDGGAAVLLVSEDLDEIFELADRIAVLFEGRLSAPFERAEADPAAIGLRMAGAAG